MSISGKHDSTTGSSKGKQIRDGLGEENDYTESDGGTISDVPEDAFIGFRYSSRQLLKVGKILAKVPFLIERPIDDDSFTDWGVDHLLIDRHLLGAVIVPNNLRNIWFPENLVREFYANLSTIPRQGESVKGCRVLIRGNYYQFSPTIVNGILLIPDRGGLPGMIYDEVLAIEMTGGKLLGWPAVGLRRSQLTNIYQILHEIGCSNWFPTRNDQLVSKEQAVVLYSIGRGLEFNLGEVIFQRIMEDAVKVPEVMCFPILIAAILREQLCQVHSSEVLNKSMPDPVKIISQLDAFRGLMEARVNVVSQEVATIQAQMHSFFNPAPAPAPVDDDPLDRESP